MRSSGIGSISLQTYISMLRGINVGGAKSVNMAQLKMLYESLSFSDVTTYIQSGNIVFRSKETDRLKLSSGIAKDIRKKFAFDVTVIIRRPEELETVIKKNPFAKRKGIDERMLHVTFLESKPDPAFVKALVLLTAKSKDEYEVIGSEIHLHCPTGYGKSLLNNTFFEKHLKVRATTRNWNTVNVLRSMASQSSA